MGSGMMLGQLGALAPDYAKAQIAAQYVFSLLDHESKINPFDKDGEILEDKCMGEIEFSNIHFNYPSRPSVKILKGFSLKVPARKTVALVGSSGCGKSTNIALLERFYDVNDGSITIDGKDIRRYLTIIYYFYYYYYYYYYYNFFSQL